MLPLMMHRMKLKNRLGLVVALFMSAFVVSYSLLTLLEVPERANAETEGAMPWVISLLPDHVDESLTPGEPQLRPLAGLVEGLREIRHIHVALRAPDGRLLAATPLEDRPVPGWLTARLSPPGPPIRKDVRDGQRLVAYFEVSPATSDELAELWEDYLRSTALVVALSLISMGMIVWGAFHALKPLDRIRDALRAMAAGHQQARLPTQQDGRRAAGFHP